VRAADLTSATAVEVVGRTDAARRVVINVDGGVAAAAGGGGGGARGAGAIGGVGDDAAGVVLSAKGFFGFLPTTTVVNFCGVPTLNIDNVGLPAAIVAPHTHLESTYGHVEGTVIVASAQGGVEFRHAPFAC